MFNVEWESFKNFLIHKQQFGNKKSNMDSYKSRFNRLAQFFGTREFSEEGLMALSSEMEEQELSSATINKHITVAKQIDKYFNWKNKTPLLLTDYKYKKEDDLQVHEIFTIEEMVTIRDLDYPYKKYKKNCDLRAKAMYGLLIDTGCRADEVCELRWGDVTGGEMPSVAYRKTKTVDSRSNFITPDTYEAIQQLQKKGDKERVFSSSRGGKLDPHFILEDLHKRANFLGIEKRVWTHLFRITFITMLINAGVDWFSVAGIVGHKDPKTTKRYYQKSKEAQRRAIARHPIFKKHLTHQQNLEFVREFFHNQVNSDTSIVTVRNAGDSLTITIEKKGFYEHQI